MPSVVKSCTSVSLSQFLRTPFNSFLSGLFLFVGRIRGERHRSLQNLSFSVVDSTAKGIFLPLTASSRITVNTNTLPSTMCANIVDINTTLKSSTEHGPQHGLRCPHRPQTSKWPQVTVCIMVTHMASRSNMDHRHQRGFRWQHGSQTSTWHLAAAQTMGSHMISSGNMDHRHYHGPSGSVDHGHQSAWPPAVAKITDTSMAFGGSIDHGDLLRRLNPENEAFISDILLLRAGVIMWLRRMFGGRDFASFRLFHILLPLFQNYIFWNTVLTALCH